MKSRQNKQSNYKRIILWFRNDLRLHDQETFQQVVKHAEMVIPFYCFDDRFYQVHTLGFPRTNSHRIRFMLKSLEDLKTRLIEKRSNLYIQKGNTADHIKQLVEKYRIEAIYTHEEYTQDELDIQTEVKSHLNIPLFLHRSNAIFESNQLPFAIDALPDIFTHFRKKVERQLTGIREGSSLKFLPAFPEDLAGETLISVSDFDLEVPKWDHRAVMRFAGGEMEGLKRLHEYLWETGGIKTYKKTRNGLVGKNYSSKFSPWLANGSLSVRRIIAEINRFEREITKNDSTYWLKFELLWREYFRFVARKYGNRIFHKGGIKGATVRYKNNLSDFQNWCYGKTGNDFVDANMRELLHTGYMSNRGRQNVASYLCKDLHVDWRWGAGWFESQLIDYDVYSNWGNWMYVAGVGNDPREGRYFNTQKQAQMYDPDESYRNKWLK